MYMYRAQDNFQTVWMQHVISESIYHLDFTKLHAVTLPHQQMSAFLKTQCHN